MVSGSRVMLPVSAWSFVSWWSGESIWEAYFEEIQVLRQGCRGSLVVAAQLPDHDEEQTNKRCECQRHRRDDARDAPCFPHVCDFGEE